MSDLNFGNMRGPRETGAYERLPDGSLRVAVPEPYWYRPWWALFHWRPGCYECRTSYKTREEYSDHYIGHHAYSEAVNEPIES